MNIAYTGIYSICGRTYFRKMDDHGPVTGGKVVLPPGMLVQLVLPSAYLRHLDFELLCVFQDVYLTQCSCPKNQNQTFLS